MKGIRLEQKYLIKPKNEHTWMVLKPAPEIYFAHPKAAGEPPRAIALWGLTYAYPPTGQGTLRQRYIARRKSVLLFQGVFVYFLR